MACQISTDHKWKPFSYFYELTEREKKELDWIEDDGQLIFRYRGRVYSLDEFIRVESYNSFHVLGWHGYHSDSFFSGILIKISEDGEMYQVGTYIS